MPALEPTEYSLYGGQVKLKFNPNARGSQPRYTVTDKSTGKVDAPSRGVTTILRDILDKPGLMTWPMNLNNERIFGTTGFDEFSNSYYHDWNKALIKPDTQYTAEELDEIMKAGQSAYSEKRDRGADIGTLAHSCVELYLKGEANPVEVVLAKARDEATKDAAPNLEEAEKILPKMVAKFDEWWKSLNAIAPANLEFSEQPVYSRKLNYCGTLDLVIAWCGRLYVLDFKTTNRSSTAPLGIYPDYFMQLGAYAFAMKEEHGLRFDDYGIVNVNKSGQLSVMTGGDMNVSMEDCERAFAFAVRLHDWLEATKKTLHANKSLISHLNPLAQKVDESSSATK